ncbi:MAG: hypothetical protein O3B13_02490 [Planctomycetota bacterium]|nr:hypothetical protein [Planctomycetota bacterium]
MSTAITGVHASGESEIRSKYPSIAASGLGRLLGSLYETIPFRIWGIKLSYLIFVLPTAPLGVLLYVVAKLTGERYVLTNRSIQRWAVIGAKQFQSLALTDVADIEYVQQPGQEYFHAGDLILLNSKGDPLMKVSGVKDADIFRQIIEKVRDARVGTELSLEAIAARA